jgi:superfamily II DNA/RNA helicase
MVCLHLCLHQQGKKKRLEWNWKWTVVFKKVINRELAYQIAEQFRVLGKGMGVKECIVVGGMGKVYRVQ